jgi:hypothetical protein
VPTDVLTPFPSPCIRTDPLQTAHIAGGYWFNGAGVVTLVGHARNNMGTTTNQMGIGFHVCNVAGVTQSIMMSSYTTAVGRSQFGAGTELFMSGKGSLDWLTRLQE